MEGASSNSPTTHTHHHRHHHSQRADDQPKRSTSRPREQSSHVSSSEENGEEFHGMPLGARISYHTGLDLDERDAFKLCFPTYSHGGAKQTDDSCGAAGDSITRMIKKMRNNMGSVDPSQSQQSEDDSDEHLIPVHRTESITDLVPHHADEDSNTDAFRQDMITKLQIQEGHSVGDYGSNRLPTGISPVKGPKANECHVFSEGANAAAGTDASLHSPL